MSVPDGAPPKLTGDDISTRFAAGMSTGPQMFLVGRTSPANAVALLPASAVDFAVTESPKTAEYQPPPLIPPKPNMA